MKIIRDLGVIILASSVMFCSVINPGPVLAGSDQENLALQWKNSTFNKLSGNLSKPLTERVSKVPDDMLRDFIESDLSIGITTARAYTTRSAEQAELELIRRYTELLPPLYGKLFSEKLVAIFLIDNFAGAGLLSWLVDDDGEIYYYMILNTDVFDRSIDDWLSFKSNSIFDQADADPYIEITTGTDHKALLYALLHEGAHLLDYELGITPLVEKLHSQQIGRSIEKTPFVDSIWVSQNWPSPVYMLDHRQKLNIYGIFQHFGLIPRSEMIKMFNQIAQTPFVSFYSASSWNEHLADFVTYHHIERHMDGNVSIKLMSKEKILAEYAPMKSAVSRLLVPSLEILYK